MRGLLQNPALLVILVVMAVRFIGQRLAAEKRKAAAPPPRADEAERTRRVREEVARKIAERRREPDFIPAPADEGGPAKARVQRTEAGPDMAEVLAEQQKLAERMRAIEAAAAFAPARPASFPAVAGPAGGPPQNWLQELRDPGSVRRAIVLCEVLGPPRGLAPGTR